MRGFLARYLFIYKKYLHNTDRNIMDFKNQKESADLSVVRQSLREGRLMEALNKVTELCRSRLLIRMADLLSEQMSMYRAMLQYFEASMTDPERPNLTRTITRHVCRAIDMIDFTDRKNQESGYYNTARIVEKNGFDPLTLLRKAAKAARDGELSPALNNEVFDAVWVTPLLSETSDPTHLKNLITQLLDNIPAQDNVEQANRRALTLMVASALMLGALQYFDSDKLLLLIHAAGSNDTMLAARAIAGVYLIVSTHPERAALEKEAADALTALSDNPTLRKALQETMMLVAKTRDTDRVTAKISREIMPGLTRIQSDIRRRFADLQAMADMTAEEMNPQWEELLADSQLTRPLEEMTEMQSNGEDVMMSAFAKLKDFSMFRSVAGWFTPFYLSHSDLSSLDDTDKPLLNGLNDAQALLCDSDKYSIALSLNRIPKGTRQMMNTQLESQLEAMREQNNATLKSHLKSSLHSEIMLYLRGTMRFVRLYPSLYNYGSKIVDPFIFPDPKALVPFTEILSTSENHNRLGQFYFKNGYWNEAIPQLQAAAASSRATQPRLLSMIGYAYQHIGNLDQALEYYDKASLISTTPDTWLLRKLGWINRKLGHPERALTYYRQLLNGDPDNTELSTLLANTLYDTGDYAAALKLYYKVEFLASNGRSTLRPVAWCELLTGQTGKARQTYARLLKADDDSDTKYMTADFMNAGHVEFVSGHYEEALRLYRQGLRSVEAYSLLSPDSMAAEGTDISKSLNITRKQFLKSLMDDAAILTKLTSDPDTSARMALMIDRLTLS